MNQLIVGKKPPSFRAPVKTRPSDMLRKRKLESEFRKERPKIKDDEPKKQKKQPKDEHEQPHKKELITVYELDKMRINKLLKRPYAKKCWNWWPNWIPTLKRELYMFKLYEMVLRMMERHMEEQFSLIPGQNSRVRGDRQLEQESALFAAFSHTIALTDREGNVQEVSFVPHRLKGREKDANGNLKGEYSGESEYERHGGIKTEFDLSDMALTIFIRSAHKYERGEPRVTGTSLEEVASETAMQHSVTPTQVQAKIGAADLGNNEWECCDNAGHVPSITSQNTTAPSIPRNESAEIEESAVIEMAIATMKLIAREIVSSLPESPQLSSSPLHQATMEEPPEIELPKIATISATSQSQPVITIFSEPEFEPISEIRIPVQNIAPATSHSENAHLEEIEVPHQHVVHTFRHAEPMNEGIAHTHQTHKHTAHSKKKGGMAAYFFEERRAAAPFVMHDPTSPDPERGKD